MMEFVVVSLVSLAIGVAGGFKLGYAYAMRVADGFSITDWMKGFLPFGKFP